MEQKQPIRFPLDDKTRITDSFKMRDKHPVSGKKKMHAGIDIAGSKPGESVEGRSIKSVAAGTVIYNGQASGYGNVVVIKDENGSSWLYAHMQKPSALKKGSTVNSGDEIGFVGHSGIGTGAHLHLERINSTGTSLIEKNKSNKSLGIPPATHREDPQPYFSGSNILSSAVAKGGLTPQKIPMSKASTTPQETLTTKVDLLQPAKLIPDSAFVPPSSVKADDSPPSMEQMRTDIDSFFTEMTGIGSQLNSELLAITMQQSNKSISDVYSEIKSVMGFLQRPNEQLRHQNEIIQIQQGINFIQSLGIATDCKELQVAATLANAALVISEAVPKLIEVGTNLADGILTNITAGSVLGPIGMIGGAVMSIIGLFMSSGPNPTLMILDKLSALSEQIDNLQTQMGRYFQAVFSQQASMLETITQGLYQVSKLINEQIYEMRFEMRSKLEDISNQIKDLLDIVQKQQQELLLKDYKVTCERVNKWLDNIEDGKPQERIPVLITELATHATILAKSPTLIGNHSWERFRDENSNQKNITSAKEENEFLQTLYKSNPNWVRVCSNLGFVTSFVNWMLYQSSEKQFHRNIIKINNEKFYSVKTPNDKASLFYAIFLSAFIGCVHDKTKFYTLFSRIFKDDNNIKNRAETYRELLLKFNGEKNYLIQQAKIFSPLINEQFRRALANFIEQNKNEFKGIINLDNEINEVSNGQNFKEFIIIKAASIALQEQIIVYAQHPNGVKKDAEVGNKFKDKVILYRNATTTSNYYNYLFNEDNIPKQFFQPIQYSLTNTVNPIVWQGAIHHYTALKIAYPIHDNDKQNVEASQLCTVGEINKLAIEQLRHDKDFWDSLFVYYYQCLDNTKTSILNHFRANLSKTLTDLNQDYRTAENKKSDSQKQAEVVSNNQLQDITFLDNILNDTNEFLKLFDTRSLNEVKNNLVPAQNKAKFPWSIRDVRQTPRPTPFDTENPNYNDWMMITGKFDVPGNGNSIQSLRQSIHEASKKCRDPNTVFDIKQFADPITNKSYLYQALTNRQLVSNAFLAAEYLKLIYFTATQAESIEGLSWRSMIPIPQDGGQGWIKGGADCKLRDHNERTGELNLPTDFHYMQHEDINPNAHWKLPVQIQYTWLQGPSVNPLPLTDLKYQGTLQQLPQLSIRTKHGNWVDEKDGSLHYCWHWLDDDEGKKYSGKVVDYIASYWNNPEGKPVNLIQSSACYDQLKEGEVKQAITDFFVALRKNAVNELTIQDDSSNTKKQFYYHLYRLDNCVKMIKLCAELTGKRIANTTLVTLVTAEKVLESLHSYDGKSMEVCSPIWKGLTADSKITFLDIQNIEPVTTKELFHDHPVYVLEAGITRLKMYQQWKILFLQEFPQLNDFANIYEYETKVRALSETLLVNETYEMLKELNSENFNKAKFRISKFSSSFNKSMAETEYRDMYLEILRWGQSKAFSDVVVGKLSDDDIENCGDLKSIDNQRLINHFYNPKYQRSWEYTVNYLMRFAEKYAGCDFGKIKPANIVLWSDSFLNFLRLVYKDELREVAKLAGSTAETLLKDIEAYQAIGREQQFVLYQICLSKTLYENLFGQLLKKLKKYRQHVNEKLGDSKNITAILHGLKNESILWDDLDVIALLLKQYTKLLFSYECIINKEFKRYLDIKTTENIIDQLVRTVRSSKGAEKKSIDGVFEIYIRSIERLFAAVLDKIQGSRELLYLWLYCKNNIAIFNQTKALQIPFEVIAPELSVEKAAVIQQFIAVNTDISEVILYNYHMPKEKNEEVAEHFVSCLNIMLRLPRKIALKVINPQPIENISRVKAYYPNFTIISDSSLQPPDIDFDLDTSRQMLLTLATYKNSGIDGLVGLVNKQNCIPPLNLHVGSPMLDDLLTLAEKTRQALLQTIDTNESKADIAQRLSMKQDLKLIAKKKGASTSRLPAERTLRYFGEHPVELKEKILQEVYEIAQYGNNNILLAYFLALQLTCINQRDLIEKLQLNEFSLAQELNKVNIKTINNIRSRLSNAIAAENTYKKRLLDIFQASAEVYISDPTTKFSSDIYNLLQANQHYLIQLKGEYSLVITKSLGLKDKTIYLDQLLLEQAEIDKTLTQLKSIVDQYRADQAVGSIIRIIDSLYTNEKSETKQFSLIIKTMYFAYEKLQDIETNSLYLQELKICLDSVVDKLIVKKSNEQTDKEQKFYHMVLFLLAKSIAYSNDGKIGRRATEEEIKQSILKNFVAQKLTNSWDKLYNNYIQFIKSNHASVNADELACLTKAYHVDMQLIFNDGKTFTYTDSEPIASVKLYSYDNMAWGIDKKLIDGHLTVLNTDLSGPLLHTSKVSSRPTKPVTQPDKNDSVYNHPHAFFSSSLRKKELSSINDNIVEQEKAVLN